MLGKFRSAIFICALLKVGTTIANSHAETLPVFTVKTHQATADETIELAGKLFGPDNYNVTFCDERFIVFSEDGTKRVEYDTVSGGIWATDESELWGTGGPAPDLPTDAEAIELADRLVEKHSLLPYEEGPVIISSGRISGSFLAYEFEEEEGSGDYKREEYQLDVSVNYDITLSVSESHKKLPIVGGGGKLQVTYGNCGKLIAYQGLWRDIVKETDYDIIPQAQADEQYLQSLGHLNDTATFNSTLAYYSAPFGNLQKQMYPVYVYTGAAQVQGETVSLRPATSRGTDHTPKPSSGTFRKRGNHGQVSNLRTRAGQDDRVLEAAIEWLGEPYGLPLSARNAAGFRDGIHAANPQWTINYERSNEDVLESDFTTNDDSYVDTVDMVFYTGHANMNGWMANQARTDAGGTNTGEKTLVQYPSFGITPENPGDLLGQQDLEWLIIAACGPHQDESFDPSAGNVFDRWRGIFDGLHIMFAYGTESYDSLEEGSRFMRYSQEGYGLIDAWFRMAKEAQPSNVLVTAMWTEGPGGNARNDHLPGYGWVSEDNLGRSQGRWFMWTVC